MRRRTLVDFSARLALALSLLAAVAPRLAHAQQPATKSPITHEAMWLMKRVGAPLPSPDGRWVVFPLTEPAYDEKDQTTDLWIVPADGSAKARRLTFSKGGEGGAAWSPDSRRLAFSAKREGDEVNQIYVLDVEGGGEAVRVTSLSTGARSPQWRPDGGAILFTSSVYPGARDDEENKKLAAERKGRKYRARVYESFPVRNWDRWIEETQAHVFVQTLDEGAKAKDLLAGTRLVAETGFGGTLTNSGEELGAAWSPDGQWVVFNATTNRNVAAYANTHTHLYRVPAAGGEPAAVTSGSGSHGPPVFSPDGKTLFFSFTPENQSVYNLTRLASLSWPPAEGARPKILTAGFDRSVGSFSPAPDSKTVYLLAEEAGHEKIFAVPASGGDARLAFEVTRGTYTNLRVPQKAARTTLFANWESATNPAELVRVELKDGRHAALTDFNASAASKIDWQPLRHFWHTNKEGRRVHTMMALPPAFDETKRYPLVVLIHGGPHTMWRDQFFLRWNYHLIARPGYVVLLTDYRGSTGYGERFAQDIQGDPFVGPAADINDAADEAVRQFPFIDGTRQAAGGASYGGHLANWLQATTTRYKTLFAHAGLINLESQWGTSDAIYHREVGAGGPVWEQGRVWREQNPIRFAANFKTPILLTVGENDFRVPLNQTLENWSVLQRLRVPSKLIVFPDENHWIQKGENSRFFYQELHAWLAKYLKGGGGQLAPAGGGAPSGDATKTD
ncbi:MAG TPA: S9 family peptidase [Pyrinomonadaceae bacterium]|nr:S9 family peptidase [Pyrinomonadaceae bacterium]